MTEIQEDYKQVLARLAQEHYSEAYLQYFHKKRPEEIDLTKLSLIRLNELFRLFVESVFLARTTLVAQSVCAHNQQKIADAINTRVKVYELSLAIEKEIGRRLAKGDLDEPAG